MNFKFRTIVGLTIVMAIIFSSCSNEPKNDKDKESVVIETEKAQHASDVGGEGEGEEDGTQFGLNDVYDFAKNGAHLIISFDSGSNSFLGTVENITEMVIAKVRVEVHLSNGIELGPTTPTDLNPGEKISVKLEATDKVFETWSTHAEVGSSEGGHGEEGEGEGEHGGEKEGEGEHK